MSNGYHTIGHTFIHPPQEIKEQGGTNKTFSSISSTVKDKKNFYPLPILAELISNKTDIDELSQYIKADSLTFISEDSIEASIHYNKKNPYL